MQQSALLFALNHVAKNKETFLENYWLKNKHTIERGKTKAAVRLRHARRAQRRKVEAAELMNLIRREGVEVHTAERGVQGSAASTSRRRLHRPPRSAVPRHRRDASRRAVLRAGEPAAVRRHRLDDPVMRNVKIYRVDDKAILDQPMTLATADFKVAGAIAGTGRVLIVDHTHRQHPGHVPLQARGREDVGGGAGVRGGRPQVRRRARSSSPTPIARRSSRRSRSSACRRGRSTRRRPCRCTTSTCRASATSTPGRSTQDEGWVRLALDTFKVPYTYFAAPKLREGNLRSKYDVIVFPHAGGREARP